MSNETKLSRYNDLVDRVNHCSHTDECSKSIKVQLCEGCNEVNLWTYWEGGRDRLDAEIMLVGQDWGHIPDLDATRKALEQAGDARGGLGYRNMFPSPVFDTDVNLGKLFRQIEGCNDVESDYLNAGRKCKKVFFTNFVCCYRVGNTSGGFGKNWTKNCSGYFRELVDIIQPKTIICLGRKAFDSVLAAAGVPKIKGKYNDIILSGAVNVSFEDTKVNVYPVAHPGAMGTLNRCYAKDNASKEISHAKGLELQQNDWKKIK